MNYKVLITTALREEGLVELRKKSEIIMPAMGESFSEEELLIYAPGVDAVLLAKAKITGNFIKKANKLKIISVLGAGYDNVDLKIASEKNIFVTNNPKTVTESTAELTIAIMLAVSRRIIEADNYVRFKNDNIWHSFLFNGNTLFGKKIGIIGFGKVGEAVARRCLGLGMNIYYFDTFIRKDTSLNASFLPINNIISEMDYITVHVPYCKDTHHLIGENEFKNMKKGTYLINASRGSVVDQNALIEALNDGTLSGAALDVFETEPYVPEELTKLSNVVLTPHIGTATIEARIAMARESADKVLQALEGKIPADLINKKELGYN